VRVVLIFNPASGGGRSGRDATMARVAEALAGLGHAVEVVRTEAAGSAGAQAREAADSGAEVVFACGGDGTVHEAIQGLVGASHTALGIVPIGSANALARHLGLALDPVEAVLQQMRGEVAVIPVGRVEFAAGSLYFAVMAGAGPDGALVYELATSHKAGWGRFAYYLHALRLFATRRFRPFALEYVEAGSGRAVTARAVCAMAVRVSSLGGLFGRITGSGVGLEEGWLRLVLVRPPAVIALPVWFVLGWLGLEGINPLARSMRVREFSCFPLSRGPAHVEADGEWLGRLPMRVSVVPDALRVRLPKVRKVRTR
jgi:diacylglycerol kinase family enzyme